jgi:hypothetical protein
MLIHICMCMRRDRRCCVVRVAVLLRLPVCDMTHNRMHTIKTINLDTVRRI